MAHPLKQRLDQLNHELDNLENVLGAVLAETEDYAALLLTEEGRQGEEQDWSDDYAAASLRIMVLSKVLGGEPPPQN